MKVLDKKTINYLLVDVAYGCVLCVDDLDNKIYVCDSDYNKLYAVRFNTYLKIDMKKFNHIKSISFCDYYVFNYNSNCIWKA